MKRFLLFCLTIVMTLSLHAKGTAVASDSITSISVSDALSIGYQLSGDDSFVYSTDSFTIIGYVSYLVPASSNYEINGTQTFWITDTQGSTVHTNSEGAIRVYYGKPNQEAQVGDKVQVNGIIMKSNLSTGSVQVDTKSYATVTILESGTTTGSDTGTTLEAGSVIQVGDFYYQIYDYGYGAYAELTREPGTSGYASYSNLSGAVTLPASITYNGSVYPVSGIGYESLTGSGISSVTVEEGVEYIDNFAFMSCSSLTKATLPSTITSLGNQVFGWSGLKTLTVNAITPPTHRSDEYVLMDASYVEHIYVPASSVTAYQTDTVWSQHASIIEAIPSGTTTDPTIAYTTVIWNTTNGLDSFNLSQYTNHDFSGTIETFNNPDFASTEINGVTATIYATTDGSYARFGTYDSNTSIDLSGGGKLVFSSSLGQFQSIMINYDATSGFGSVGSSRDWSSANSSLIWSGTAADSVVLEDAYAYHISSIVFTIASGTATGEPVEEMTVPTATDLMNAGFNPRANVVLALYFDQAPCNDVVLTGSFASWSTDPAQLNHFVPLSGFEGWYAVEVPFTSSGMTVKPAQLDNDGTFTWDYQSGDAQAWIHKAGSALEITSGIEGEADIAVSSIGAYIYELAYWKNHNTPCTTKPVNYTICLLAPECDSATTITPAAIGTFSGWTAVQMEQTVYGDKTAYICQITDTAGSQFKFYDAVKEWDNEILIYNEDENFWVRMDNLTLPEASADTFVVYDFSDPNMYAWADCSGDDYYTVILYQPDACPDMKPAIVGSFCNWQPIAMQPEYDNIQDLYYICYFNSSEEPTFKIKEATDTDWTNEMQYYQEDAATGSGEWRGFDLIGFEGKKTIVLNWRDNSKYRYAKCASTDTVSGPRYTIVLLDPVCTMHSEFAPQLIGEFSDNEPLSFEKTVYGDSQAWIISVTAEPGSTYELGEVNFGDGNQIQYYDAAHGYWLGFPTQVFPEITSDTTIVLNYSDSQNYRYPLCWSLNYDDYNYENYTIALKAPAGAPEKIAVVGDFITPYEDGWDEGILMKYKDGVYTATVKTTSNGLFRFREYKNSSNYIEYVNNSPIEYQVIGDYQDKDDLTYAYVDLSDSTHYKWVTRSEYVPVEVYYVIAQADSSQNGFVTGSGEYKDGETAVLVATPRADCTFAAWSDGNTLNPRSVRVTGNAEYTAIFRRNVPVQPVICSDTMYFTSADTVMIATRVYSPTAIEDYDKLIIATVNNKNVMGFQYEEDNEIRNFRTAVSYTKNMNIANVSVVEAVPNGEYYRLRVADGELAPRCEDCTSATNQLYATWIGADWYFANYEGALVPEALGYGNRMILYNEEAPRFSSYRQVTGLDRSQTTVFKLHTPRNIPATPEDVYEDLSVLIVEDDPMDSIAVDVEPQDTVAVISTPHVDFVHSFTLIIWADEAHTQVLLVITYDAEGQLLSVTRPSAVRRLPARNNDVYFEVNDLTPNSTYHYTLVACEDDGSILTSLNSSFVTTPAIGTALQNALGEQDGTTKIIRNGQLFILRNGKWYNALGVQLK